MRSFSLSALKMITSSRRFRNSGLKVRLTSFFTRSSTFSEIMSSLVDWKPSRLGFQSTKEDMISEKVEDLVRNEVKRTFNPEFLNRLDEVIIFNALSENDLIQILELMVSQLNQNLAQKSITVTVTDEAKRWILNQTLGDRSYGARPLRRALQKYIEDPLSEALIQGTITTRPAFIEVFLEGDKLYYRPVDSEKTEGVLLYEN